MREYVLKKGNKDYVPKDVMMQVKYRLHGYERIKKELNVLRAKKRLTQKERKRFKAFEKEVFLIDEACAEMAARLKSYADGSFDCISAYFSYEHYNMHIKRSGDPDDVGAGPGKWSGYKRQFTKIIADKFGIV